MLFSSEKNYLDLFFIEFAHMNWFFDQYDSLLFSGNSRRRLGPNWQFGLEGPTVVRPQYLGSYPLLIQSSLLGALQFLF